MYIFSDQEILLPKILISPAKDVVENVIVLSNKLNVNEQTSMRVMQNFFTWLVYRLRNSKSRELVASTVFVSGDESIGLRNDDSVAEGTLLH